ncbi:MAG: peptidoglycan editing factor PgeF [Vicinamibacterales bacterium]
MRRRLGDSMNLPVPDPAFRWTAEPWGPALRCAPLEAIAQHAFTSRQLQLPADDRWAAAAASVGGWREQVRRVKQVHGSVVRVLQRGDMRDAGPGARPDGDAIVSNEAGLVLAVMVADCVPILVADRSSGAAGAIHAGWRGTCARVGPAAVEAMRLRFGTEPSDLVAAIGPSIGPDDYAVGEALIESFQKAGHAAGDLARWFIRRDSQLRLDLWSANRDQLIDAGLQPEQIFTCGLSTLAHTDVFDSFRSEGERAGRMAALVVVPKQAIG